MSQAIDRRGRRVARGLAVALGLAAAFGCRVEPYLPGPDVVARLGEGEVRAAAFDRYLAANVGEQTGALPSDVLSRLFDQFVTEQLLLRLAEERGLAKGDARQTIDALLGAEAAPEPSAEEIARYYDEHAADFQRPERVRLRQILVEDRQEAERARRQLAAGEPFAAVAERVSRDARATAGGEQGELTRDDLPPAFADLIFALPDGGISQVVEADYGFLVFEVVAHRPAQALDRAQAEPEIRRQLARRRADETLSRLVADAQSRYAVQIYDRNLPFEYRGSFPIARPLEGR
jgi:hypothetical protein